MVIIQLYVESHDDEKDEYGLNINKHKSIAQKKRDAREMLIMPQDHKITIYNAIVMSTAVQCRVRMRSRGVQGCRQPDEIYRELSQFDKLHGTYRIEKSVPYYLTDVAVKTKIVFGACGVIETIDLMIFSEIHFAYKFQYLFIEGSDRWMIS